MIRIEGHERDLSEVFKKLDVEIEGSVEIEEIVYSPGDETLYLKLKGEMNGKVGDLKNVLSSELGVRVVFAGDDFKIQSVRSFLMERLRNGLVFDVECHGDRVIVKVPGDFMKDRMKLKLKDVSKELKEKFREIKSIKVVVDEEFFRKLEEKTESVVAKFEIPKPSLKAQEISPKDENRVFGRKPRREVFRPSDLSSVGNEVSVLGKVFRMEERGGRRRSLLLYITDGYDSVLVRIPDRFVDEAFEKVSVGKWVIATGTLDRDPTMDNDPVVIAKGLSVHEGLDRKDSSDVKRIELHAHSKYSDLDSVLDISDYVKRASEWGFKAVAITDHGNVQAIPEFYEIAKEHGVKPIFGMEGYMVNDVEPIVHGEFEDIPINEGDYVVLDLETSGLDPTRSEIVEIGAVRVRNGSIVDEFHTLIKPRRRMSFESTRITGITDEMLENQPSIEEVLPRFLNFIGDSIIVAHNASFDYRFLKFWSKEILNHDLKNPYIDTLSLARSLLTLSSYSLEKVVTKLKLGSFRHHRALDDAEITARVFLKFLDMLKTMGMKKLSDLEKLREGMDVKSMKPHHVTILVKNREGLKNLYRLVTLSHTEYFHNVPKIPKSLLNELREGLLIGSACVSGEMVKLALEGAERSEIEEAMKFYDFVEVMPLDLVKSDMRERLKKVYRDLYSIAKSLGIPVVMTGDVHFLDPADEKVRMVLMSPQTDDLTQPKAFFRTTDEMIEAAMEIFEDEKIAREIVVKNPNEIADSVEEIAPIEKRLHPPIIEGSDETVRRLTIEKAKELYGDPLPDLVEERLEKELSAIIDHGYSVLYLIAKKLVDKSREDGYVVGSRGSVGSSLVAYLLGITEVNPLPPHYVCPECKHVEFVEEAGSGYDLPERRCPKCGAVMDRNGQDIPFEVFMGFEGDKIPDIDLNFSGEYQDRAHRYIETLFGKDHVYRAGTINTIAQKSARGYVRSFEEKTGLKLRRAEFERLSERVAGVKRTTGQHPGGLMIIPKDRDVHDFTPVQYPANDKKSGVLTTHFAYEHIHDDLVKIDALGHDDPTFIKYLKEITGIDPMTVPMNDPETLEIFRSTKPLGIDPRDIGTSVGTFGIPEFGTKFVRGMLEETRPKSFAELVRISGLSHGTDVWLNNARDWINKGVATLSEVISCRDDIMNFLIHTGMEPSRAFKIMEKVRKGKGISEEDEAAMKELGVPNWFIESCKRIKYLFPKAHAVAYVSMAFRIAYFKVHHPLAFYSAYFTIKGDEFNLDVVLKGKEAIKKRLSQLYAMTDKDVQDKNEEATLEVALEMILRGYSFLPPDISRSDSKRFIIEGKSLRIPFNKIPGLGDNVAESITSAREEKDFSSVEDLVKRTKVNRSHIEVMRRYGVLKNLPDTDQFTLF